MAHGCTGLTYEQRLRKMKLMPLQYRRRRGDLIALYKIMTDRLKINKESLCLRVDLGQQRRGHKWKLQVVRTNTELRRNSFANRIVEDWNKLSGEVLEVATVNAFKSGVDRLLLMEEKFEEMCR